MAEFSVACIKMEQLPEYYSTPAVYKIVIDRVGIGEEGKKGNVIAAKGSRVFIEDPRPF